MYYWIILVLLNLSANDDVVDLLPIFAGSMEAAMSETGSSDSNAQLDQVLNLQPEVSAQTGACSTSQHRKLRAQTKWPSDIIKVAGFNSDGFPTNDDGMKCWQLICGLIARQRVEINVHLRIWMSPRGRACSIS